MIENSGSPTVGAAGPFWHPPENGVDPGGLERIVARAATLLYCTPFSGSAPRHGDISINHGRGIRGGGAGL